VRSLSVRERRVLLLLGALWAAVAVPVAVHKGPDFVAELGQAERLLHGRPLFEDVSTSLGLPWPPFSALALVPFALVAAASVPLAKACWALAGVACVVWSSLAQPGLSARRILLAVAAVGVPLETNFEYLNISPVLLALTVAAALDLEAGRDGRAGVWIGLATALKAFPGLLLLYLALGQRWRALVAGVATALAATVLAVLPYGLRQVPPLLRQWVDLALAGGWVVHVGNQSLAAMLGRAGATAVVALFASLSLVVLAAVVVRSRVGEARVLDEVGLVLLVSVLVSPIAWSHYYTLMLPAWMTVLRLLPSRPGAGLAALVVAAGIATSGILTVWSRDWKLVLLGHSIFVWGALALCAVLVRLLATHVAPPRQSPLPT
jgi:hypothetical protein